MSVYIVTGKLGNGKTLGAVSRIQKYIMEGRRVATNLDLYFDHWPNPRKRNIDVYRLPDKPAFADMVALGRGYEGKYDERKFGLLVLDECGTWFNSRNWNDPGRKELNDWFLHSRKLGWDVIIIIQSIEILDKQARDTIAEHTVFCRRMDNLKIPVLSGLTKAFLGFPLSLPRVHVGLVKYGTSTQSVTTDKWWYRGSDLYALYDTQQVFLQESVGLYSYLTPWHLVGRYLPPVNYWALALYPLTYVIRVVAYGVAWSAATLSRRSLDRVVAQWGTSEPLRREQFRRSWSYRLMAMVGTYRRVLVSMCSGPAFQR